MESLSEPNHCPEPSPAFPPGSSWCLLSLDLDPALEEVERVTSRIAVHIRTVRSTLSELCEPVPTPGVPSSFNGLPVPPEHPLDHHLVYATRSETRAEPQPGPGSLLLPAFFPLCHQPQVPFTIPVLRMQRLGKYCDGDDDIYIGLKHSDTHNNPLNRPSIRDYYPHFKAKETKAQDHLGNCPELFPL